jgi:hypothetical protein
MRKEKALVAVLEVIHSMLFLIFNFSIFSDTEYRRSTELTEIISLISLCFNSPEVIPLKS